jgi:hypothetical protein
MREYLAQTRTLDVSEYRFAPLAGAAGGARATQASSQEAVPAPAARADL